MSDGLNGLKPQVHRPPLSFEMVTTPPIFPLLDEVVLPDPELHAAASISTAPATATARMRFIVTALRPSTRCGTTLWL